MLCVAKCFRRDIFKLHVKDLTAHCTLRELGSVQVDVEQLRGSHDEGAQVVLILYAPTDVGDTVVIS